MIARHFPKQLPKSDESAAPGLSGEASAFAMNLNAVNAAQVVFLDALKKNDASGIDETVQALDQAPKLDDETNTLRDGLKSLLARAKTLVTTPQPKGQPTKARVADGRKLLDDFNAWQDMYENWTKTESQRYGVKLTHKAPPKENFTPGK